MIMKEMTTEFKPSEWIVPELREPPTSMTLYPRIALDNINLPCIGELPENRLFHVDEKDIVK